jgi:hypothetical protein
VPAGTRHGWRNASSKPLVALLIITTKLARFFQEVGKPITATPHSGTGEDPADFLARLEKVCAKYGYWNATPEENAKFESEYRCDVFPLLPKPRSSAASA